jgi:adenylosuccinate lyase
MLKAGDVVTGVQQLVASNMGLACSAWSELVSSHSSTAAYLILLAESATSLAFWHSAVHRLSPIVNINSILQPLFP